MLALDQEVERVLGICDVLGVSLGPFHLQARPHTHTHNVSPVTQQHSGCEEGAGYEDLGDVAHALDGGEL